MLNASETAVCNFMIFIGVLNVIYSAVIIYQLHICVMLICQQKVSCDESFNTKILWKILHDLETPMQLNAKNWIIELKKKKNSNYIKVYPCLKEQTFLKRWKNTAFFIIQHYRTKKKDLTDFIFIFFLAFFFDYLLHKPNKNVVQL